VEAHDWHPGGSEPIRIQVIERETQGICATERSTLALSVEAFAYRVVVMVVKSTLSLHTNVKWPMGNTGGLKRMRGTLAGKGMTRVV
jgi:hypothetical protein